MPMVVPSSSAGRSYEQTAKGGVTVTSGGSAHALGSWATLIDPVDYDVFGVYLNVSAVSVSATDTRMLMNLGVATTGGGDEQIVIDSIDVGAAGAQNTGGKSYFFPLFIPAGKALRAQTRALAVSDTCLVVAHAYELPYHGYFEDAPQWWETYGEATASSQGTAVTSGSGAFGTEVDITSGAGTTRDHRWFTVSIGFGTNTTISAGRYRVRLALDTGAANVLGIWEFTVSGTAEDLNGPLNCVPVCVPVPSGSLLYVDIDGGAAEAMTAIVHAA